MVSYLCRVYDFPFPLHCGLFKTFRPNLKMDEKFLKKERKLIKK